MCVHSSRHTCVCCCSLMNMNVHKTGEIAGLHSGEFKSGSEVRGMLMVLLAGSPTAGVLSILVLA